MRPKRVLNTGASVHMELWCTILLVSEYVHQLGGSPNSIVEELSFCRYNLLKHWLMVMELNLRPLPVSGLGIK